MGRNQQCAIAESILSKEGELTMVEMDEAFNDICANPGHAPVGPLMSLAERLITPAMNGEFDSTEELLGMKYLDTAGLLEYLRQAVQAFSNPGELYGKVPEVLPVLNMGVAGNLAHYAWHSDNYPAGVRPRRRSTGGVMRMRLGD